MTLLQAVDSAYPTPVPEGTSIVLGYLGRDGETPHTWTFTEVEAAAAHHWFGPIWCPRQGAPIFNGQAEGEAFLQALFAYGVPKGVAVFLDVEFNTWALGPEADAEVHSWQATMGEGGYVGYAYGTKDRANWVADWPRQPGSPPPPAPDVLPEGEGVVAWQYAGEIPNTPFPAYDLSVALETVPWWGKTPPPPPTLEEPMLFVLTAGPDVGGPGHVVSAGQHYILSGGYRILALDVDVPTYTAKLGAPEPMSTEGVWRWQHD